jgi:iron(III) transport system ATP-binding protein
MALECHGLAKSFGEVQAVREFNLSVPFGQIMALLGPSGCGKTTALRLIAGFESPDVGTIVLDGQPVWHEGKNVPPDKRPLGIVFQEGALFPHMTVEQNVGYGLKRGEGRTQRVRQALELVGLESYAERMPHQLSGGQQQRVALARALAPQPQVLLLDEPFSNLDPGLREQVRRDTLDILRAHRVTAVFVTHDQDEALLVGDQVAVMNQGRIEQLATPEDIFHHPASRFVAEFIGMVDFLPAGWDGRQVVTQVGSVDWPGESPPEENMDLEVMVRPDCLECRPLANGSEVTGITGVIKEREFRGAFYVYRVALPTGHTVRCLQSHTEEYPVGEAVEVTLRDGHGLRPFLNGQAIDH